MDPATQHSAAPVDVTKPNMTRVYDYMSGGKDNLPADREAAERIEAMFPGMRRLVRQHREFARAATAWLAGRGIAQFLDVGCGMPGPRSTVEVAREVLPGARFVYVDSDGVALSHLSAMLGGPGVAVVAGDAGDPEAVLAAPELRGVIELRQPAGLLLAGVLSGMGPEAARDAVRGYSCALAPGSAVAISCVSYADQGAGDEASAAYGAMTGGTYVSHPRGVITGFFDAAGLELVQGGVADVRAWWEPVSTCERDVAVLGGVGIVP